MITLLFILFASHAILYVRAFMNFVMLIYYRIHDDLIPSYMKHTLYRIQKFKNISRESRKDKRDKKNYSNFSKIYILTY